jgi:hypothetical protein
MVSISFTGDGFDDVLIQLKAFVDRCLKCDPETVQQTATVHPPTGGPVSSTHGYRPSGVGLPELRFAPIDDGKEWDSSAIRDWINGLVRKARVEIRLVAQAPTNVIDPRREASLLGWSGTEWSGVWNGPRNQARRVRAVRGLKSWPYGHTYVEPRRIWMHPAIAARVLEILNQIEGISPSQDPG